MGSWHSDDRYLSSMPSSKKLLAQMYNLLNYLSRQNVLSFLVVAQHGVIGSNLEVPVDISYLADMVLLLRHFEAEGELKQAINVYKNATAITKGVFASFASDLAKLRLESLSISSLAF